MPADSPRPRKLQSHHRRRPVHPGHRLAPQPGPEVRYAYLRADFCDSRINPEHRKRNHIRQIEALGNQVTLEPAARQRGSNQPGSA